MVGGNTTQTVTGITVEETLCLRALISGQDVWRDFNKIYDGFIYRELAKLGVVDYNDRADIIQELAMKLYSNNCAIIRRFLINDTGYSFRAVLRTIIRSIVIDEWRKHAKWRNNQLVDGEPALQLLAKTGPDSDPANDLYREARLASLFIAACGQDNEQGFLLMSLRYIDCYSVDQIGKRLGVKPNAVSQRIRYYLRRLKKYGWVEVQDA